MTMKFVGGLCIGQSESVDRQFACLGLILGIVMVALYLLKSPNPYLLGVGIIAVLSGILYLKISGLQPQAENISIFDQVGLLKMSNIAFFAIMTFCTYLSTRSQYIRPLHFFVLFSIAFALISLEIIFIKNIDKWCEIALLTKILFSSLVLRSSIYFQFPSIIGIDAWFHAEYIQTFVTLGHIPNFNEYLQPYYFHFPLMHLNVSLLQIISPLEDLKVAIFSSMGTSLVVSTLFIFLIGKKLFGQNIGLLAVLLINFSDFHILWGTQIIATTLGIIQFTAVSYLILTKDLSDIRVNIVLFIFLISIVLTHTISSFAVLMLLILIMTIHIFLKAVLGRDISNSRLKITLILCFGLILVNYWTYADYMCQGQSFFNYSIHAIVSMIENADFLSRPVDNSSDMGSIGIISGLVDIGGFLILVYFTTIGFFVSLRENIRENINALKMGLLTFTLFVFIFGFPLLGVRTIIPTRWFVFLYVPMVIIASYGVVKQLEFVPVPKIRYLLSILVLFSFCFLMITNSLVNLDTPLYTKNSAYRYAYTETELTIAEWVNQRYSGKLIADYYYGKTVFEISLHRRNMSYMLDDFSEGIFVWRDYMLSNPVIVPSPTEGTSLQEYRVLGEGVKKSIYENSLIYSNGNCAALKLKSESTGP